ncbi:MAG: hypothetical protein J6X11_09970 [Treponema sp.]|nr:hypothetical protein [Treponema sp.]
MEPQKVKWHFIYSETLKQRIAYDEVSGWLFCKDGTKYSPQELKLITANFTKSHELPLAVHLLKKEFGGEIVSCNTENEGGALNLL